MQKVLMIEDDEIEQKAFQKFMAIYFPEVLLLQGARDGIEGLSIIEREEPDLLILDIQMPDMDGLTLLRMIHEKGYKGKIIIQTAYGYFDYVQEALNCGADAYILKPVGTEKLREVILRYLKEGQEERQAAAVRLKEKNQAKKMREYIMEDVIGKLLMFEAKQHVPLDWIRQMGIDRLTGFFIAVQLQNEDNLRDEKQEQIRKSLKSALRELEEETVVLRADAGISYSVFVVSPSVRSLIWYQYAAEKTAEKIKDYFFMNYGVLIRIGVGKAYSEIEKLYISYQESWQAVAMSSRQNPFIFYQESFTDAELTGISSEFAGEIQNLNSASGYSQRDAEKIKRQQEEQPASTYNVRLHEALLYIQEHFREDLSLQRIADQVGISPYYLSHLFHKQLKSDFTGYIFQLRMQYMMQLLQKKEYTVRELAEKLGYHDVGYFSRVVKKYTGKTVGEIKRNVKKNK